MTLKKHHDPVLDAYKVLGCAGVVLCHVASTYGYIKHNDINAAWVVGNIFDTYSRWAVVGFYLLSGYFAFGKIPERFRDDPLSAVWAFYRSRLLKVFVPALLTVMVYMLSWGPYDPKNTLSFPLAFFQVEQVLRTPAYPLWFLYPLALYILITPLLWRLSLSERGQSLIELAIISWFLIAVIGTAPFAYWGNLPFLKGTIFETAFNAVNEHIYIKHLGWFLIGGCMDRYLKKADENAVIFKRILAVFIGSLIVVAISPYIAAFLGVDEWAEGYRDYTRPPVALFGITSLVIIPKWLRKMRYTSSIAKAADLCLPIYLFHAGVIELLKPWSLADQPFNLPLILDLIFRTLMVLGISALCGGIYNRCLQTLKTCGSTGQ
jgi:surface polysaccharide O-acyltransferase-like enzyme